ncbi:MAG: ribonucleotide reductase subunit alpha [Planctomycetes bacterium]|nr:ribonucleotide reductase subunit alpha [Planctomycetota bacterium]MCP4771247.1 ribonucleotide reductase subunit alpha [Planctomycetota bacterium]MCP4862026.1 ribonucleotide reductase subunit alpha [Planctomycetota bacterium]
MNVSITDFATLLQAASQQQEPQRLLFVFLNVALPQGATPEEEERFKAGQGGQLMPVICVDKSLDELTDFDALVAESDAEMGEDWKIVLVAAMSGENGQMPTSEDAEEPLKSIANDVVSGGDLSNFLAFKRNGEPVLFN